MAFEVRAEHAVARKGRSMIGGSPTAMPGPSILEPAGPGEAHIVTEDGYTLCGKDASRWRRITSPTWERMGFYRCPTCLADSTRDDTATDSPDT